MRRHTEDSKCCRLLYATDRPPVATRCRLLAEAVGACHHVRLGRLGRYTVWTVNGSYIRDNIDIDFVAGGNPARYAYVPEAEIWVERGLVHKDTCATILHEAYETRLMYQGISYEDAHDEAAEVERQFRQEIAKVSRAEVLAVAQQWLARG